LIEMVEKMPADEIVILPNNKNIIAVADKVGEATDKHVRVVPTTSMTEAFAALLEYDPEASADDNSAKMAESAAAVISGEVCQAVRESSCEVGPILEGDYMGIGPGGIMAVNADIGEVAIRLLDRIVSPGHEVVTLIEGDGASDALTRHITLWLQEHRNGTAVEVHHGGQPLYPYLFGVE
jgi:dihydroxyacetone kinase-like predicted kinase